MSDWLTDAKDAVRQQDWPLLDRHLTRLLTGSGAASDQPEQPILSEEGGAATDPAQKSLHLALQVLEWGDFQTRWEVAKLFPAFGSKALLPLIERLQDEEADLETRWFAARILSRFDTPEAAQALIEVLQTSEDEELSAMAAEALAALGSGAIAALTTLLATPNTRFLAVRSLAQIRRSETIAPLLTVVTDPDPALRELAIEALSSFHDPRIPPVLVQALTDPVAAVRRAAIDALSVRADLAAELDLVNRMIDRLWDLNGSVCQQAAIALGRLGGEAATDALFRALQTPQTAIGLQLDIVRALGWIATPRALEYLQQLLGNASQAEPEGQLAQEIVAVLGRWSKVEMRPQVTDGLIQAAQSTNPAAPVKQAIALALGQLKQPQALNTLVNLLADPDLGVRLHAIAALKALDSEAARYHLEHLAAQNPPELLRQGIIMALQEWTTHGE